MKHKRQLSSRDQMKIKIRKARTIKQTIKFMFLRPCSKWAE
jgi:hypothetical protein